MNRQTIFDECELIRYDHADFYRLYHEIPLNTVNGIAEELTGDITILTFSSFDYPDLEIKGINDAIIVSLTVEDTYGLRIDLLEKFEFELEEIIDKYSK